MEAQSLGPKPVISRRMIAFAFGALFLMNMLDYMDRNILFAVLKQVRVEFRLSDFQSGSLAMYFLISYSIISPLMGRLGDKGDRNRLLFLGVATWSIATIGSGLARNYGQLVLARCFLGIGEATYGAIAPALLMDLFSRESRARVMSMFYLAMPLGSALGMALGGTIAHRMGDWRPAFFLVGIPGLLTAVIALFLPRPVRGASENMDWETLRASEKKGASRRDYAKLFRNRSFLHVVLGTGPYTFAIGGMLVWIPTFLSNTRGIDQEKATQQLGVVSFAAAIVGMGLGGWLADRWTKTQPRALFLVPGISMLTSIPFVLLGLLAKNPFWIFTGIFLAEMFMFVNTGPCNAIISNVVAPNSRALAYAAAVFGIHFLGDVWSPSLMGYVSDSFARPEALTGSVGRFLLSLGASPTIGIEAGAKPQNLLAGLLLAVPAIAVSGIVFLSGSRYLPGDSNAMIARLKQGETND